MNEYTAHIQVPDAVLGSMFQQMVLEESMVTCCTLRSGSGTWLSFGVSADDDDTAVSEIGAVRHRVSLKRPTNLIPEGYEIEVAEVFASSFMIVTNGRTVVHSEGI